MNRIEGLDQGGLAVIGHVHRHLHEPAVREFEAFRPYGGKPAVAFSDCLRDPFCHIEILRPEIHIPGDQHGPSAHDARARGRMQLRGPEVRPPVRIRFDGDLQSLEFPAAHIGEGPPIRPCGGGLVQVDRDPKLLRDSLPHGPGQPDAVVHRHPTDGNEREDIEGSDPRMLAAVRVHIDEGHRGLGPLESSLGHGRAIPDERDDATIMIRIHFGIEQPYPRDRGDRLRDCVHHLFASSFGKIGDALHNFWHPNAPGERRKTRFLKTFLGTRTSPDSTRGIQIYLARNAGQERWEGCASPRKNEFSSTCWSSQSTRTRSKYRQR